MATHNLELAQKFVESQRAAAARELERHSVQSAAAFMQAISLTQSQRLMAHLMPAFAASIVQELPAEQAAAMLSGANSNQIAAVFRRVTPQLRGELLGLLPITVASRCRRLLSHSPDTVGAWMSVDLLLLPGNITVAEALQRIAADGEIGDINALPLIDAEQKLIGRVGIRDLLNAKKKTLVSLLRRDLDPVALPSRMSLRAARSNPAWQNYDSLFVLNQRGQPEGLLRHAALLRALSVAGTSAPALSQQAALQDFGQAYLHSLGAMLKLLGGGQQPGHTPAAGPGAKR